MGVFKQIGEYLWFSKKDASRPKTFNVRMMHGINRLSILLFLIAIIIILVKLLG
ncbi:MAG: DUF6728 family protein [Niabella sp.]